MLRALLATVVTFLAVTGACAQTTGASPTTFAEGRASVGVEVLALWFKSSPTPVPIIVDHELDHPSLKTLLGGGTMSTGANAAFRVFGSFAVNHDIGVEANVLLMPSQSKRRGVSSDGTHSSIDLLLPYYDVTQNAEEVTEISFSPEYEGRATEKLSHKLTGGEINVTWKLPQQGAWHLDLLGGVRYLRLREDYTIATSSPYIPPNPADVWNTADEFDTTNRFVGAQIGLRGRFDEGPWTMAATAKVALGSMRQKLTIDGRLETNDFTNYGPVQTFTGGYFATPTNIGSTSRSEFAIVPEIGLDVGYRITPSTTLFARYSFLYLDEVARPGEQIDRRINPSYSLAYGGEPPVAPSGPAEPTRHLKATDFWAQSLSIGIAYRF